MATCFSTEETIARPASEVWTALTDWERAAEWMPGIDSMTADGETAEGTELTFVARGKERSSTIAHCEPSESVTLRSVQGPVTAEYTYTVTAVDATSSTVTLVADCEVRGVWRVFAPLLRIAVRRADSAQLERFKRALVSRSTP